MQVYTRLQERLGLKDHAMILNLMLSKIAINLKVYGSCDDIITQTLNLFQVQPRMSLHTQYTECARITETSLLIFEAWLLSSLAHSLSVNARA